ncbi:MAG: hypothetical protein AAFQ82_12690 [Myxococcota bacterium]
MTWTPSAFSERSRWIAGTLLVVGVIVALYPLEAAAQVFARAEVGAGLAQTSSSEVDTRATGPALSGEVSLGYELAEHLHAGISTFIDRTLDAERRTSDVSESDTSLTFYGAGLNGQWSRADGWWFGGGAYLIRQRARSDGGSLVLVALEDSGTEFLSPVDESGWGGAIALKGGRDWPIGESVWAGFVVRALYGQFDSNAARWSPVAGTLSVSVTYR